jgi:hypothetical protein
MKAWVSLVMIGLYFVSGNASAKEGVSKKIDIKGKWASEICEFSQNPNGTKIFYKRLFTITDKTWAMDFSTFGDANCSESTKLLTVDTGGKYKLGKESLAPGGTEGEFMFSHRKVTPKAKENIAWLNSSKICGFADWTAGKAKDLQKTGCAQFGAYPLKDCKGEYDIVKLEGNKLYFGARPADSNLCSADRRAKEFGAPLIKM